MSEKTLFYPLDIESMPIIRYAHLFLKANSYLACSHRGWIQTGQNISVLDGGDCIDIEVCFDFYEAINRCDQVVILETKNLLDIEQYVIPQIVESIRNRKKVICLRQLETKWYDEIRTIVGDNYYEQYFEKNDIIYFKEKNNIFRRIETPVVAVVGGGESTNKLQTELSLMENFTQLGYKVCLICSRNNLTGKNIFPQPNYLYENNRSEYEKICSFNQYVFEIEKKEKPDLIILGLPGGTEYICDSIHYDFGLHILEAFKAVPPDAVVYNFPFLQYIDSNSINYFAQRFENKFEIGIDALVMANLIHNSTGSHFQGCMDYYVINHNKIKMFENLKINDSFDDNQMKKIVNLIENKLASNAMHRMV